MNANEETHSCQPDADASLATEVGRLIAELAECKAALADADEANWRINIEARRNQKSRLWCLSNVVVKSALRSFPT